MRYISLLIILIFLPGCIGTSNMEKTGEIPANAKTLELEIEGMACPNCEATIQGYLMNTEGIVRADVSYENRSGTVVYDPSLITEEEILDLRIFQGSFTARVKKNENRVPVFHRLPLVEEGP